MSNLLLKLRQRKFVIAVHESVAVGPGHQLRNYLVSSKAKEVIFIVHPLINTKEIYKKSSRVEFYKNGRQFFKKFALHWRLPDIALFVKDFLYTIFWCVKSKSRYDLFVGLDPLNALAGLFLRKIGVVERSVYYTIDYMRVRFENSLLNRVYHLLDLVCVKYSDETWNIADAMVEAREKYFNMNRQVYNKQFTVPIGVWFKKAPRKRFDQIDKKKIIFVGHLVPMMGVDLILKSLPEIAKKIPDVKLDILGGGPQEEKLRKMAAELHIQKYTKFYGWVADRAQVEELLSTAAVGLAPFNTKILKDEVRNADPAKLKDYMLLGLPVIVTDAISNTRQIKSANCAIVIQYKMLDLVNAIVKLLSNEDLLAKYRLNALKYIKQFDYESLFSNNLKRILSKK